MSPESLRLLDSLLSGEKFASYPQITSARIFLDHMSVSLPLALAARSISRYDLDAALLDSARRAGVRAEEGIAIREVDQSGVAKTGLFEVKTAGGKFYARAVVNATGRWSQLTRQPPSPGEPKWVGLKAHFREESPPDSVDLYFFSGGYCGVQKVGPATINAAAMVQASACRSLEDVFAAHRELSQRSQAWEPLFPAVTTSPLYFRTADTEDGLMLRSGDAAGFIDPFAGDGISFALHSGSLAAEALNGFFQSRCSLTEAQKEYGSAYKRRFAKAFRNAARLRRLLATPSWLRSRVLGLVKTRPIAELIVRGTRAWIS